jgi:hypothetical protein
MMLLTLYTMNLITLSLIKIHLVMARTARLMRAVATMDFPEARSRAKARGVSLY